jgi:hypothetical protein
MKYSIYSDAKWFARELPVGTPITALSDPNGEFVTPLSSGNNLNLRVVKFRPLVAGVSETRA